MEPLISRLSCRAHSPSLPIRVPITTAGRRQPPTKGERGEVMRRPESNHIMRPLVNLFDVFVVAAAVGQKSKGKSRRQLRAAHFAASRSNLPAPEAQQSNSTRLTSLAPFCRRHASSCGRNWRSERPKEGASGRECPRHSWKTKAGGCRGSAALTFWGFYCRRAHCEPASSRRPWMNGGMNNALRAGAE